MNFLHIYYRAGHGHIHDEKGDNFKFFTYNLETGNGFMFDPPEDGLFGIGIGIFAIFMIFAYILAFIILTPFVIPLLIDKSWVFIGNNKLVFFVGSIIIILMRLFVRDLSEHKIINILFSMLVVLPIIWFFFYRLHFLDAPKLLFLKMGTDFYENYELGHVELINWCRHCFESCLSLYTTIFKPLFLSLDSSVFTAKLSDANILALLGMILRFLLWIVPTIIFAILGVALLVIGFVVIVAIPYLAAFGALAVFNYAIFYFKKNILKIVTS